MTMPDERYRSLVKTEKFLQDVVRSEFDSIAAIRAEARRCLHHFPWGNQLEELAEACPHILEKKEQYSDIKSDGGMDPRNQDEK